MSELGYRIVGWDSAYYGEDRGIHKYPEMLVDGKPLIELIEGGALLFREDAEVPIRRDNLIPILSYPPFDASLDRFLLRAAPDMPATGRYGFYACEWCGNPAWIAITAEIVRERDSFIWRRFGSEVSYYDPEEDLGWFEPDAFPRAGPYTFEWEDYSRTMEEILEVAARLWNEWMSVRSAGGQPDS